MPVGFPSRSVRLAQREAAAVVGVSVGRILTVETQCRSRWCWAAVAQSVAKHFNRARFPGQEQLAFHVLRDVYQVAIDESDCIRAACGPQESGSSDYAIDRIPLDEAGVASRPIGEELSEASLQEELQAGRPVCVIVNWSSTRGSHAIAIVGAVTGSDGVVRYMPSDPLVPDAPAHTYEQLVNAYNTEGRLASAWLVVS